MISFQTIPDALRYPGAYIEIDGSQAGLGDDIPGVLLVGQKLSTGTAAAGEIIRISSVADAIAKAGQGSMLAQMAIAYRKIDQVLDLYMLPYADNPAGVKASAAIEVFGPAQQAGTLSLYIAGMLVSVGFTAGESAATIADNIASVIDRPDLPVTAQSTGSLVTITAKHAGSAGNNIDINLNLFGESLNGIELNIDAMVDGQGDPAPGDLSSIIGHHWYRYVALGMNDAATLAAWHAESQARYKPPVQNGFRVFAAYRGDYFSAANFGQTKNYEHISLLALAYNPTSTWEAAAIVTAAAAPKLWNNPVESLEGIALPGMLALEYYDWTQANGLLFNGMSIMQVAKDGSCSIKRLISMYQTRADGTTDDAFLDINAAEVMERIRYTQRIGAIKRFVGTAAAKNNEGYRPGLRITTVDDVRAYLLSTYKHLLMAEKGWVQDYEFYKTNLVVEQDASNPSRFNYLDTPVILSPFYVLAGRAQFRKTAVI